MTISGVLKARYMETRKAAIRLSPTVVLHSIERFIIELREHEEGKAIAFAEMGYESEIESDFGKRLNFRHRCLCSVHFPSLSTLSFSVYKSHPKGPPCLTMSSTIKPLSRYLSIIPLPFSFRSHPVFFRPVPGPPSPSPCNVRHSARTVTS